MPPRAEMLQASSLLRIPIPFLSLIDPGITRVDSFHNVIVNPKAGLLFLVPGHPHSLGLHDCSPMGSSAGGFPYRVSPPGLSSK
jgi:hypothetical protein